LTGAITLNTGGMILAGTTTNGVYVSPAGIVGKTGGVTTFSVDGTTGAAVFKGDITGASGTFTGSITGASGTFGGSLAANTITAASGAIADLAVTTGKIANLAVETLKIAGNAVTIPVGTTMASSTAYSTTETTIVSTGSILCDNSPIWVVASITLTWASASNQTIRIKLGSTVHRSYVVGSAGAGSVSNVPLLVFIAAPGSGTLTPSITVQSNSSGGNVTECTMICASMKK
jgi:hypothetical protein